MIRILSAIISVLLFFGSAGITPYELKDKDNIRFSAVILSDMHVETNNPSRFSKDGGTLAGVYAGGNVPDVLAFAGDNTMNGQVLEWFDFYGFVNRFNKGSDVLVSFGNHDFGNTDDTEVYARLSKRCIDSYNYYCRKDIDKVYYSADYGNIRFIILGSDNNAADTLQIISDEQIAFLSSELAQCKEKGIPAVVINHNLIRGKNGRQSYFSFNLTDNNDALENALVSSGADVIYVCGHSHFGLSDSTVNTEGKVTYINLPSAGNDGNYGTDSEECSSHGLGMLLELYDSRIEISFKNFAKGTSVDDYSVTLEF